MINFTQNIIGNEFCDIPDEHEETNNKCSVQSRYSQNRSELTSLLYINIYIYIYIYHLKINIFYINNDFSVIYSTMLILRKDLT